jgi:PKD repeat protein
VNGPSPLALHTYLAAGTYTVALTVTDGHGHSATDTTSLKVGP